MTQSAIFSEPTNWGCFIEMADVRAEVAQALRGLRGDDVVVAFGPALLDRLAGADRRWVPAAFADFQTVQGPHHTMPATQRDLFVWLKCNDHDVLMERGRAAVEQLAEYGQLADLTVGFDYRNSRDLIGFEDGTANPKGDARMAAALVPDDQSGGGGAFVFTQKWRHDVAAFERLAVPDQERVVGRTRKDSIELEGDAMPANSHVSRTDLKVDGVAQKIYRRSMPWGDPAEHGLFFLAFACAPSRVQVQLESMVDASGTGVEDALLDYSRAISGAYWFAPSDEHLNALLAAS